MSLVTYDFGSDSEDNDADDDNIDERNVSKPNIEVKNSESNLETSKNENIATSELFSKLPKTKSVFEDVREDKIEDFIPKSSVPKEKPKVKITIPSLSQFEDDEDEPKRKKFKPSSKVSGLMSLLPPIKTSVKTEPKFIPHVIANKFKNNPSKKDSSSNKKINKSKIEIKKVAPKNKLNDLESDDDDDIDLPETFDDEIWEKACSRQKLQRIIPETTTEIVENVVNIAPESEEPYDGLDNKAFKELVGKTKRPLGNIKLIDINEEEILPDKDLWLTKSLTDPEMAPKDKIEDPVDPTRRKKHHITYLAQQAKANEKELQSAWAASKNNRLMSRAKYGF